MAAKKTKKEFNWEKGAVLSEDLYAPLGKVRDTGFSKLADGLYADPVLRKEARKARLSRVPAIKDQNILVEESHSGLQEELSASEASRLIQKDRRSMKGISRFNAETPRKSPPGKLPK